MVILVSFLCAGAVLGLLLNWRRLLPLDHPNERSLHQQAIPRTGGIAVLAGTLLGAAFSPAVFWLPLLIALLLAIVSFIDDLIGLPAGIRLVAHVAAAATIVWYLMAPIDPTVFIALALAVGWITNLYNFMDGADGLAGGMAVVGFGTYAIATTVAGDARLAGLSAAIAAASCAFLMVNFHPARIFLGDVGSIPLGFLAAALGLAGWRNDVWPLWFPVLVFGPFIADATITLIKRLIRGNRLWQAHRDHYYQRMVLMGLGHRGTAWIGYGLMILCAAAALLGRDQAAWLQALIFLGTSLLLGIMAIWVDISWARFVRHSEKAG